MDNKVIEQIEKLLAKTREKKIPWKYANSNVVRWVRQDGSRLFTVTVQVQTMPAILQQTRPVNYSLSVQATNPNEIILEVKTTTDASYRDILKQLFDEAMSASRESSSDILDKLLGDL